MVSQKLRMLNKFFSSGGDVAQPGWLCRLLPISVSQNTKERVQTVVIALNMKLGLALTAG
jgi:hypothetical protein